MLKWFEGKKTYIGLALAVMAAAYAWWTGIIDGPMFVMIVGGAVAFFGVADKFRGERFAQLMLTVMEQLKRREEELRKQKEEEDRRRREHLAEMDRVAKAQVPAGQSTQE